MKKAEVQIGKVYVAKVSGKLAKVKVYAESPYGGWLAENVETKRVVRIKSAMRLRYEATRDLSIATMERQRATAKRIVEEGIKQQAATPTPGIDVDVEVSNEGTIFTFLPRTDAAKTWIAEHVQDPMWHGNTLVVDQRFALGLAQGMVNDGLRVR
jgi:hypothetical protein